MPTSDKFNRKLPKVTQALLMMLVTYRMSGLSISPSVQLRPPQLDLETDKNEEFYPIQIILRTSKLGEEFFVQIGKNLQD